ncbi:MAG: copper homeostasis protein CutC [Crocinitomicaceae bacterium]|nr:copper homeostasis protein CutC [Crocinitomicaceae bacterium]
MKLELCAASVKAIHLAKDLKFDRIELCENLMQGGITPSAGRIEFALNLGLETHLLVRPRPGGFNYSAEEIQIMASDIKNAKKMGVKGVVVGTLNINNTINTEALKTFLDAADGIDFTFHRAFDEGVFDWKKRLDILIDAGVTRVLTSGLARNVSNGMEILKEMKEYAGNKIQIMPGGGINAGNVAQLIKVVRPEAIHFSGTVKTVVDAESNFSETFLAIDEERVKRILSETKIAIDKLNLDPQSI